MDIASLIAIVGGIGVIFLGVLTSGAWMWMCRL